MAEQMNIEVAARLEELGRLLDSQGANEFRVRAYLNAARTVRNLDQPVAEIVRREGVEGLKRLAGIGDVLARSINQLVTTGRLPMLERLRSESDPAELLASVPGIGRVFAERLHDELGIDTLEELEAAAYDGRLANIAGFGVKRIAGIRDTLSSRLGRVRERAPSVAHDDASVSEILDVDREYRTKSQEGLLTKITPRRFNPTNEAWLPILHTERGERHYTALFSNTARAHQMQKTRDWVVLYYDGGGRERQCTVITSQRGPLQGKRIVRGREAECMEHYGMSVESEANHTKSRLRSA